MSFWSILILKTHKILSDSTSVAWFTNEDPSRFSEHSVIFWEGTDDQSGWKMLKLLIQSFDSLCKKKKKKEQKK